MGKITKVWLDESNSSCINCGMCESYAPDIFRVVDKMEVLDDASDHFETCDEEIREAAKDCPVSTIAYAEDGNQKRGNEY